MPYSAQSGHHRIAASALSADSPSAMSAQLATTDATAGLAAWVKASVASEVRRLVALGERVVAVPVANVGVVVEAAQRAIVNRVEIASSFDTTAVEGLMLSPPTEVPVNLVEAGRGPLVLHFLVLQTRSPVRLLAGVVVEPTAHAGNDLTTWRFVNNKLVASTHVVSF